MEASKEVKNTSFYPELEHVSYDRFKLPTWAMIVFLIVVFFVLKTFIYLPDKKRHGK